MEQYTDTPETVETDETAETHNESELKSLADLLALDEPDNTPERDPSDKDEGKAAERPEKAKPKSLKALAETLKLEDKDLYDIEVPMANGESKTLGQLKDLVAKQDEFSMRELEFEETRQQKESELIRAQQELRDLVAALPPNAIKPEALEAVRQKHEAKLSVERQRTLEVIPEWNDENKRTEELTGIVEHLSSYGFPNEYISTIYDHRTLKYIRDNWQREQRIRRALAEVKKGPPSKTSRSRPNGAPNKPNAKGPQKQPRDRLEAFFQR